MAQSGLYSRTSAKLKSLARDLFAMSWGRGLDWDEGEPKQSLKQDILDIFEANPDTIIDVSELREALFPDVTYPSDVNTGLGQAEQQALTLATARIHTLVEILIDEGRVEKREFDVDMAERISQNEEEYEQVSDAFGEDVDDEMTLYKFSQ